MDEGFHKDRIVLSSVPGAVQIRFGLPQVDWRLIGQEFHKAIEGKPEACAEELFSDLGSQWLDLLHAALGDHYQRFESSSMVLLSAQSHGEWLASIGQSAILNVQRMLRPIEPSWVHPIVVIEFESMERFYDYLGGLPGDDNGGSPIGVFISWGHPHIVMGSAPKWELANILAHEIAHAFLYRLPLPLWLDEALAMTIEGRTMGQLSGDRDIIHNMRNFWRESDLDSFWNGCSFHGTHDEIKHSYDLALALFQNIKSSQPENVSAFVSSADRADAGASAACDHLGISLGEIATQLIGIEVAEPRVDEAD
jgi:hypothetical protein